MIALTTLLSALAATDGGAPLELTFVPEADPKAKPRIFRHIGANLSDEGSRREEFSIVRKYFTSQKCPRVRAGVS